MPWSQKVYFYFISLLSWVLPKAGALQALTVFLTPTRVPRPPSEKEFFESARKYELPQGTAAFEWGRSDGSLIILVHGWSGRGTQMGAFAAPLVAQGFRVIAVDGPAHGGSAGETTNIGAFAQFLIDMQKSLGAIHGVIAHSFGAGCVVVGISRGLQVQKVVLIAGPARYERVLNHFFERLPISPWARKKFIAELKKKAGIAPKDLNIGVIGKDLKVDAMIVHDTDDKEVGFQSALEIHEVWPQSQLLRTEGLGHRRILRDPQVLKAVTEFMKS